MEQYQRPKPKLLDRVKAGIASKVRETIATAEENRAVYRKTHRKAELQMIKRRAREDVFKNTSRAAKITGMRERLTGTDADREAYRKKLYGG